MSSVVPNENAVVAEKEVSPDSSLNLRRSKRATNRPDYSMKQPVASAESSKSSDNNHASTSVIRQPAVTAFENTSKVSPAKRKMAASKPMPRTAAKRQRKEGSPASASTSANPSSSPPLSTSMATTIGKDRSGAQEPSSTIAKLGSKDDTESDYEDTEDLEEQEDSFELTESSDRTDMPHDRTSSTDLTTSDQSTTQLPPAKATTPRKPRATTRQPKRAEPNNQVKKTIDPRPKPYGRPLVWAEGRQALCETVCYYRAYQSGGYTAGGVVYGQLVDEDTGVRPYMDEDIVITRAGGACTRNATGIMEQANNHVGESKAIQSFVNNKKHFYPLVLIIGQGNRQCPSVVPHVYCVMDWFHVTDVWAEMVGKDQDKTCFKYRMEKVFLTNKSWWAAEGTPDPVIEPDYTTEANSASCISCKQSSKQIYQECWLCLHEKCEKFWEINGQKPQEQLTFNSEFLKERTKFPRHMKMPREIVKDVLDENDGNDPTYSFDRFGWKGMVCPNCGRCNSRALWNHWACETPNCGFTHQVKQPVLSVRQVYGDGHSEEYTGTPICLDTLDPLVRVRESKFEGYPRIETYELPIPGNIVAHFLANKSVNAKTGGPNDMFRRIQTDSRMNLRRSEGAHTLKGPSFSQYFTNNFGMDYKYFITSTSTSFRDAPDDIVSALHRMNWAGEKTDESGRFQEFNECLAVGYFEGCKMEYHDDGEKELGPTIATLSLGGPAVMTIRMKSLYYTGLTSTGAYDPTMPVLPGAALARERQQLNTFYEDKNTDFEKFNKMQKDIYRATKITATKKAPVLITMPMVHGDIIVMHGADMQKYYEHKIVPTGKLRFGLTCRHIKPAEIPSEHRWKAEYDPNIGVKYYGDYDDPEEVDIEEAMAALTMETASEDITMG